MGCNLALHARRPLGDLRGLGIEGRTQSERDVAQRGAQLFVARLRASVDLGDRRLESRNLARKVLGLVVDRKLQRADVAFERLVP